MNDIDELVEQIYQLEYKIEQAERELEKAKDMKSSIEEELQREFGCKTITQADKKLSKLQKDSDKMRSDLEVLMQEIEKEMKNEG